MQRLFLALALVLALVGCAVVGPGSGDIHTIQEGPTPHVEERLPVATEQDALLVTPETAPLERAILVQLDAATRALFLKYQWANLVTEREALARWDLGSLNDGDRVELETLDRLIEAVVRRRDKQIARRDAAYRALLSYVNRPGGTEAFETAVVRVRDLIRVHLDQAEEDQTRVHREAVEATEEMTRRIDKLRFLQNELETRQGYLGDLRGSILHDRDPVFAPHKVR